VRPGRRPRSRRRPARRRRRHSGPPVAPEDVTSLFEPFHRLDGRAGGAGGDGGAGEQGIGLGLSIVRAVATMHDARLDARARPDGGLQLTVELAQGE
jgi:signal transduction histidine kinase